MKLPCEEAIWYVLPQIRADLAKELVKRGVSQKDVAEKLGVTPSAVSQYMHKKRAGKITRSKDYDMMVINAAEEIIKDSNDAKVRAIICQCCKQTYENKN